ncbi:MAG: hypothetical protein BLITH_0749 [Brockia lithotrophica]|uniref:Major facilitator superfamily (MFS) profile domain-containing protein n=1 Tax=Brockia lithotrophica TaxID=933949 RepID=A0A2T5G8R3_9BACL|nr:hypothetical protein [Brockia lithotrophica]PTQ52570.1 MAG: hypothetical protein BLITH_0749 [Brockia lithotrophica]
MRDEKLSSSADVSDGISPPLWTALAPGVHVHPDHATLLSLLDRALFRRAHLIAWDLASGGTFLDGFSVFMLGMAIPLVRQDLALAATEIGLLGSAIGMDFPTSSSYIAECMPLRNRARVMVATIAAQAVGMVVAPRVHAGVSRGRSRADVGGAPSCGLTLKSVLFV